MSFAAGQIVRCVDPEDGIWLSSLGLLRGPKRGDRCTVVDVELAIDCRCGKAEFLRLAGFGGSLFFSGCFRPIEDEEVERLRVECLSAGVLETV